MSQIAVTETNLPICRYDGAHDAPPPLATWPMDEALWKPFVDSDELITFSASVPLATLLQGEPAGVVEYLQQAFSGEAIVRSAEFRVIGHETTAEFDKFCCGDVHLQVTGELVSR